MKFFQNFLSRPNINMKNLNLRDLDLSLEESRDIIEFLARRKNVSNYERMTNEELLSTLKKTPQKQCGVKILQTVNCMINYLFRIFNYS